MEDPLITTASGARVAQELLLEALRNRGSAWLPVQGDCMRPLLDEGDRVEVSPHAPITAGSLVLARRRGGELVCHRVLSLRGGVLELAGDRSLTAEEHLPESLLGVVRRVRRKGVRKKLVQRGDTERRLDGRWCRFLDRLQARLHRLSLLVRRRYPGLAVRLVEMPRRGLLALRGYGRWFAGSEALRLVASRANKPGVWSRGPASSR